MPHSAIYRYFENKDDLFRHVLVRGRDRQRKHDAARRGRSRPYDGAMEWIMAENRCYAMAIARAAMEGQTGSSLGLAPAESTAMQSVRALTGGAVEPDDPAALNARIAVAATMALTLGWAIAEDWVIDAVGLEGLDRTALRSRIDEVLGAVAVTARDAGKRAPDEG